MHPRKKKPPRREPRLSTRMVYTRRLFTGQRAIHRPELVEGAGLIDKLCRGDINSGVSHVIIKSMLGD